ncbi:M48 family metallopeptidase [Pyrococcus kukulkanii]|uniref:M48 family metallopeptidase n=1 Tax=Pyrococcus kukulkanii TaxID=1609559 RepID=UPI00356B3A81
MRAINLNGKTVRYRVKVKPVRYVTIRILEDGTLLVTTPDERIVEKVLMEKRKWILSKLEIVEEALTQGKKGFPLFGEFIELGGDPGELREKIREHLRTKVKEIVDEVSPRIGARPKRIYIIPMRNKWGTATWRKSITINLASAALPHNLLHYLVTHELAHLIEMRHSKKFWSIVSKFHPDYKKERRELKKWWFIVHANELWRAILRWPEV